MQSIENLLATVAIKRSVGSKENDQLLSLCENFASSLGYEVQSQNFPSPIWSGSLSFLRLSEESCTVLPSPFSPPCKVTAPLVFASQKATLVGLDASASILVVHGSLAKEPMRDSELLGLLSHTKAKAIICLTGMHDSTGLSPFPLITSASFSIPSCYAPSSLIESLLQAKEDRLSVPLQLFCDVKQKESRQLLIAVPSCKPTVLVTAQMDCKYGTQGALHHASSVATLLSLMQQKIDSSIAFLLTNGQAYDQGIGYTTFQQFNTFPITEVVRLTGLGCKQSTLAFQDFSSTLAPLLRKRGVQEMQLGKDRFSCVLPELLVSSSNQSMLARVADTQLDTLQAVDMQILTNQAQQLGELLTTWRSR